MNAWILESMLVSSNDWYRDWKSIRTLGLASTYESRIGLTWLQKNSRASKRTFLKGCEVGMSPNNNTPRWTLDIARCGLKSKHY